MSLSNVEYLALYSLWNSTDGLNWNYSSYDGSGSASGSVVAWNFTGEHNPCAEHWAGVTCANMENNTMTVSKLILSNMNLHGPISSSISNLQNLYELSFPNNKLQGTLPLELGYLLKLDWLELASNDLHGTIPNSFTSLTQLRTLDLELNMLSGSLQIIFENMVNLEQVYCDHNNFYGSLPLTPLPNLKQLSLEFNALTGPLPLTWSGMASLEIIDYHQNYLTGSLDVLTTWTRLTNLTSCYNDFTSAPKDWSVLQSLVALDVSSNQLTGSIESMKIHQLPHLTLLNVSCNKFSGSLNTIVNISLQKNLAIVDVSNNKFTGAIPSDWFQLQNLETLSLMSNCFHGSFPATVCDAQQLRTLSMDALSSSRECVAKIIPLFPAYKQQYRVSGSIPECVFNLPKIQTLHLSGNSFSSSLNNDLVLSSSLVNLDLSHNLIVGSIPSSFCDHSWNVLNLGFNKISGHLCDTIHVNSSLTLQVNRLSGRISSSYTSLLFSVNILSGNLFACGSDTDSALPANDPNANSYDCGSNSLNSSMYIFLTTIFLFVMFTLGLYRRIFPRKDSAKLLDNDNYNDKENGSGSGSNGDGNSSSSPKVALSDFDLSCRIEVKALLMLLTIYIVGIVASTSLHASYNTYTFSYAWIASFGLLSGVPAAVIMILYLFFAVALFYYAYHYWRLQQYFTTVPVSQQVLELKLLNKQASWTKEQLCLATVLFLINFVVSVTINIYFVLQSSAITGVKLLFLQVALALFKFTWGQVIISMGVPKLMKLLVGVVSPRAQSVFRTLMNLTALVVAPCIATAVASPNCFYYLLFSPPTVTVPLSYSFCNQWAVSNSTSQCAESTAVEYYTSYTPTFTYSYQCSSSLMVAYTSVFFYQAAINCFATPVMRLVFRYVQQKQRICLLSSLLDWLMPPLDVNKDAEEEINRCYRPTTLVANVVTMMVIAMTFGFVYPLLGVAIVLSLVGHQVMLQLELVLEVKQVDFSFRSSISNAIDVVFADFIPHLTQSTFLIVVWCVLFFSLFLFDTLGDEIFGVNAIVVVTCFLFPCTAFAIAILSHQIDALYWARMSQQSPVCNCVKNVKFQFENNDDFCRNSNDDVGT